MTHEPLIKERASSFENWLVKPMLDNKSTYLKVGLAAMLMAALDGIQNKTDPGRPLDKDIYDLDPAELESFPGTPRSLEESLQALRNDHDFLLRGDVFTEDVIDTWIWYKTAKEIEAIRERPHPYEFAMYYDI